MEESTSESPPATLSDDELRRVSLAKEQQKERDRQAMSRRVTRIGISVVLLGILVFVCFPDKPKKREEALSDPSDGTPPSTAESDAHKGDMKFALDLLRYVQPEGAQGSPPSETQRPADEK